MMCKVKHAIFFWFQFQSLSQAKDYMKRKIIFVTKQMEKVQPILMEKSKMRQSKSSKNGFILKTSNKMEDISFYGQPIRLQVQNKERFIPES